jgi:hypothetical protein
MLTAHSFRTEVEAFLTDTGMSATAFGRAVVSDPNFVSDLREGRMPSIRLVEKVQIYIRDQRENPPQKTVSEAS